jgi:flavodoxin I
MKKTGLIYSFNSKKTAIAAKIIHEVFGEKNIDVINAEDIDEKTFLSHDYLILGVPTWFDGELPNYWDEFVPAMEDLDLKGKTIAIFGNGDQKGYPENFVDGIGIMAEILEKQKAKIIGFTSVEGYEFERSRAKRGNMFAGLALDFENQRKLNKERIAKWVDQLKKEFT